MLDGNNRLIIVVGMAHSGTTILTYILQQHPDVVCCVDGTESWVLENTMMPLEQTDAIQQLLYKFPAKRLLLKRPWNCVWHSDWMEREMANAKYLYCLRSFEETSKSWCKPTSYVDCKLRDGGVEYQRGFYQMCLERATTFKERVPNFKIVHHKEFLAQPSGMMTEIGNWLGLSAYAWDVSKVSPTLNIKDILCKA